MTWDPWLDGPFKLLDRFLRDIPFPEADAGEVIVVCFFFTNMQNGKLNIPLCKR